MRAMRVLLWCLIGWATSAQAAEPVVLVTVKPLAWLAQALTPAGVTVQVLVPEGVSPHEYQLRAADALRVKNSALLLWVGPAMESWLAQLAQQQPANKNLALLPDALHADESTHEHEAQRDPHIWLDPIALREHANGLATRLIEVFPADEKNIRQRQAQFEKDMTVLDAELSAIFAPVAAQGFVVYHDGYQRLVQRYHLNQRAAVWQHESIAGGVRDRAKLLQLLNSGSVRCLFYEPEHGADIVNNWLGNAAQSVNIVELDPLGTSAINYADFLRGLSGKMAGCLAKPTS
jgi:zinc transport system substrate-binding protein